MPAKPSEGPEEGGARPLGAPAVGSERPRSRTETPERSAIPPAEASLIFPGGPQASSIPAISKGVPFGPLSSEASLASLASVSMPE
jgi:hypothetical protein